MIDWFVACDIEPEGEPPASVEDVFTRREPFGEYLFHAAGDQNSRDSTDPRKIDGSVQRAGLEVCISPEPSTVELAGTDVEYVRDLGEDGDRYRPSVHGSRTPDGVMALYGGTGGVLLPIDHGNRWASWVDASRYSMTSKTLLRVVHKRLDGEGVVEILGYARGEAVIVEDLVAGWRELMARYGNMSMRPLSGALAM